ncbi:AfsR/SARP family transcriptional regulator [Kitasatospora nipponensis]
MLGSLLVRVDGESRPIGSALQRSVLAALLLKANQVVPAEALVALVWEDSPPEAPRQALNNHIMRLRKALGPSAAERIRTQAPGHLIEVRPGELDAEAFAALYRRARSAAADQDWRAAGEDLRDALALWRGEALLDVPSQRLRQDHLEALEALRFQALQLQVDSDLHLGRFTEATGRLHPLRAAHPWHERLVAQLIIALYGSGEQTEALAAYRAFRDQLADELGVEPGRDLHQLQQAVLQQDPAARLLPLLTGEPSAGPASALTVAAPALAVPVDAAAVAAPVPPSGVVGEAAPPGDPNAGAEAGLPRRTARGRLRSAPRLVRTGLWAGLACCVAAAVAASLGLAPGGADAPAAGPVNHAATLRTATSATMAAPDGHVRYLGRIGFDDQILTTTGIDVPVVSRTHRGDVVLVSLTLTATSAGTVSVKDSAGNTYTMVGDVVDAYWHRTMLFAAFDAKQLDTVDRISASYPQASKYHLAADVFSGVTGVTGQAGASNLNGHNSTSFSTSAAPLSCAVGDLLVSVISTNSGPAPQFSADWQALPVLTLSSYRQTTAFRFVAEPQKCAATGTTTAQWEALAVLFHR